jgi:23S rRNA pseudouridine2605 synthase
MQDRLQKIISRAGIASRRAGEEIILAGRVRVNGRVVTELGAKADLYEDNIEVDGRRLIPEAARYLVLHKPRGVVSTLSDPEGRPTVAGLLEGAGTRLYPVGRLDFATSGVLLVTNDGDFANGLLHPRGGVPKTYVVKTRGTMTSDDLERWRTGVELEDGRTLPAEVSFLRHEDDKTWFEITLREGRNQQIRRMGEATRFPVMRLARTSFAGITSEDLRPGQWRPLTLDELLALREHYGVPKRVRGAAPSPAVSPRRRPKSDEHKPRVDDRPARPSAASRRPPRQDDRAPRATPRGPHPRSDDRRPHTDERPPVPRSPGHFPSAPTRAASPSASSPRSPEKRRREGRH